MLLDLGEEDMKTEMGIHSGIVRRKLLRELEILKGINGPSTPKRSLSDDPDHICHLGELTLIFFKISAMFFIIINLLIILYYILFFVFFFFIVQMASWMGSILWKMQNAILPSVSWSSTK
jgi:hypothetical protein